MTILPFVYSLVLPEKLEYIVSRYAEHSHDKWAFDKVGTISRLATVRKGLVIIPGVKLKEKLDSLTDRPLFRMH